MKTLVTHKNPHLDDVCALWLFQRFLPVWKKAEIKFISTNPTGGVVSPAATQKKDPHTLYIGVGRGMFDEHKGNIHDSATTLVWKFIKKKSETTLSPLTRQALEELTQYVNDEDHAKFTELPLREFSFPTIFSFLPELPGHTSKTVLQFGYQYLDGVFAGLLEKYTLEKDWKKRIEFKTKWGRGVGITTATNSKIIGRKSALTGHTLFIYVDLKKKYKAIKANPDSTVDLTNAYKMVKKIEPKAEWYLHHSKRMLICGSDVAANLYLSALSLKELIHLVQITV